MASMKSYHRLILKSGILRGSRVSSKIVAIQISSLVGHQLHYVDVAGPVEHVISQGAFAAQ